MTVHDHGPEEGPGLSCNERQVGGRLVGACISDDSAACAHCAEPIARDALGRWAHTYDVRGHNGPWFYCQGTRGTRAAPAAD